MGTVVSKEEVADSHLGNATMSLNLSATSNLLRNEIDKMNDRLGEEEEDEDEEMKKKHVKLYVEMTMMMKLVRLELVVHPVSLELVELLV